MVLVSVKTIIEVNVNRGSVSQREGQKISVDRIERKDALYHNKEMMFWKQKLKIISLIGHKAVHNRVFDSSLSQNRFSLSLKP